MSTVSPGDPHTAGLEFRGRQSFHRRGWGQSQVLRGGNWEEERRKRRGGRQAYLGDGRALTGVGPQQPKKSAFMKMLLSLRILAILLCTEIFLSPFCTESLGCAQ